MNKKVVKRLVIVSNRLPFSIEKVKNECRIESGSGGLVTALAPVLKNRGGLWIGWPGMCDVCDLPDMIGQASKIAGYNIETVFLSPEEVQRYYIGLSNEVLWPLFHDLQSYCNFNPDYWRTYEHVNRKFAEVIAEHTSKKDFVWVHDYQLILVARELRLMGVDMTTGFFLHIPFPPLDIFLKLPWRSEILRALLNYDLIGFQTMRDRKNFIQCLKSLTKGVIVKGKGQVLAVQFGDREIRVGCFPVSIDYQEFVHLAKSREVADRAWYIHEDIPLGKIMLGIDRLDYSKGIPYRIKAFRKTLENHPELHRKITLIQVVVPSRRNIPVYNDLKLEIEQLISEINGRFTRSGWVPIQYIFRPLSRKELLAYYRTAEIALITPLKDGMNLVSKEYCACNIEESGVVILSEFAGAAAQLQRGAILVNPYNIEEVADAIYRAYTMNIDERRERMKKLRHSIARNNIYHWVNSYLEAAIAGKLDSFPIITEYTPWVDIGT